jgi:hypothetical protein
VQRQSQRQLTVPPVVHVCVAVNDWPISATFRALVGCKARTLTRVGGFEMECPALVSTFR